MIYTSYFAKLKSLPDNIVPISICAKAPDWYKGLQYKKLAPKYDFFMKWEEIYDNDYYIKCFKCGGGICKNLWTCRSLAVMPPITEYEYRCNNEQCENIEYLRG